MGITYDDMLDLEARIREGQTYNEGVGEKAIIEKINDIIRVSNEHYRDLRVLEKENEKLTERIDDLEKQLKILLEEKNKNWER